ncbi:MAG: hypothetical protein ACXWQQ_04735 [Pseudobdellovibrio sp.]
MKPSVSWILLIPIFFFFAACTAPVGTTTLLVSGSSATSSDGTIVPPTTDDGVLSIQADNQDLSATIDDTDKVEVSGSCVDLDRRKNRIIVEVFPGEDENQAPYISNAISDYCQQSGTIGGIPSTGNGTNIGDICFWVTNGIGVIEDPNIPSVQKSFPQCHNGRFGFAVRLGGVLTQPSPSGSRYTIRFKIRTQEGEISESTWSRAYVTRKMNAPSIDSITADSSHFFCSLQMSPARFNQNILYSLSRGQTGVAAVPDVPIFTNLSSAIITSGNSAYSYSNDSTTATKIISGVTYTYTLSNLENTVYSGGFAYSPALTETSAPMTCTIPPPPIEAPFAPTNVPVASGGTGPTCYLKFTTDTTHNVNPGIFNGSVGVRWAYSTTAGWTGPGSDNDTVPGNGVLVSTCNSSVCTSSQVTDALQAGVTYYFAAQEFDQTLVPLRGKWSNEVACKPPSP